MAFHILREGSEEYAAKMGQLKAAQLRVEADRWARMTDHDRAYTEDLVERFLSVIARNQKFSLAAAADQIEVGIKKHKPDIAQVQGNIEIARLHDLLSA